MDNAAAQTEATTTPATIPSDPDGPALRFRSAYRDLSCKMSGPECYRQVVYPTPGGWADGATLTPEWPDGERLCARGIRAHERRATVYAEAPAGTLVVDFERSVYKGSKGKCQVRFAILTANPETGKAELVWLDHRTLRSRPVYEITLPDGRKVFVPRRVES